MYLDRPTKLEHVALNKLTGLATQNGLGKAAVREHRLIVYKKLKNDQSTVDFKVNRKATEFPGNVTLSENDLFVATRMGIAVQKVLISDGEEVPANGYWLHYGDKTVWAGAAVAPSTVTEAGMIEAIFHGQLKIETNQAIRRKEFPTSYFRYAPRGQEAAGLVPEDLQGGIRCLNKGIVLAGGDTNAVEIKLIGGESSNIAGDGATYNNYAVFIVDGFALVEGNLPATKLELEKFFGVYNAQG